MTTAILTTEKEILDRMAVGIELAAGLERSMTDLTEQLQQSAQYPVGSLVAYKNRLFRVKEVLLANQDPTNLQLEYEIVGLGFSEIYYATPSELSAR